MSSMSSRAGKSVQACVKYLLGEMQHPMIEIDSLMLIDLIGLSLG